MGTKKEEKPSTEDLARERIVTIYRYNNKKLLLVCKAAIKGKTVNLFAALDKTGITLYEYKETYENKVKQLENHSWVEWNQVIIDHYFIKSTFGFSGNNNGSLSISFTSNGKEAQQIITNNTDLNIQVVSRPLYRKILGFRSWKTWKMITAIAMYVAILFIITNEFTSEKMDEKLASLAITLESLTLLGLVIGLIKPKYVLPFSSIKNRKRIGKVYGTLLLVFFIISLIFLPDAKINQAQIPDDVDGSTITKEEDTNETVAPSKQVDKDTIKENILPISSKTKLVEKKEEPSSPISTALTSAVVTRFIDGDTIKVKVNGKEETVRMILVDTPETKHPKLGVQPFGPEASSFTKDALTGEEIELEKDVSDRDKYGRLLRYVWIDGKLFNKTLIEKGLARVAVFQPDVKYIDQFRELQQKAQKQGIGIWSIENYAQEDGYHTEEKKSATAETPKSQPQPKQEKKPTTSGSCNIKGNISSSGEKIFHVPGGQFYDITEPEAMFCSKAAALAAGYRASKR